MKANFSIQDNLDNKIQDLINTLPKRSADIMRRRFGLSVKNPQTLAHIGSLYGITRERIRQIELNAFKQLKKQKELNSIGDFLVDLKNLFEEQGKLISEERLFNEFITNNQNTVNFILTLAKGFHYYTDQKDLKNLWTTDKLCINSVQELLKHVIKISQDKNKIFTKDEIFDIIKNSAILKNFEISDQAVLSYLDASKNIEQNVFGEFGLSHWPEIMPHGVKDKAYLILKKENKPLHFGKIAEKINIHFQDRKALSQTVHNELIKDQRFVLVGRGLYALIEHGYMPGTVGDVLIYILKKANKALSIEQIQKELFKERFISPSTVVFNLKANDCFEKLEDGKYILKEQR